MSDVGVDADSAVARTAEYTSGSTQRTPSPTLTELLGRVGDREIAAFADLYDQTSARVYGVALRVLRDAGFAEETTQEVYLEVWKSASRFDPAVGSAMAWLTTMAHRRAVDRVRSEQSLRERTAAYCDIGSRTSEPDPVSEEVLNDIVCDTMSRNVALLTNPRRESVTLAYYGGLTYREVSERLGVPLPTIKSRIRAGLIQLRESLGTE